MTSQAKSKNISETIYFQTTIRKYLLAISQTISRQEKFEIVIEIFTLLNKMKTVWINNSGSSFKMTVIDKSYELLEQIQSYISLIKPETLKKTREEIHKTLRLVCCNKIVKGRYCKRKKICQYCTFHTNIKNQTLKHVTEATESYIIKDVTNIICDYISL